MFRGVNVAHKYANGEVGAALPRFLPRSSPTNPASGSVYLPLQMTVFQKC